MRYEKLTTNVRSTTTVLNTGWISETFVFIFTIALEGNVNKICTPGPLLTCHQIFNQYYDSWHNKVSLTRLLIWAPDKMSHNT